MTDRPTEKVNYILDAHWYRKSSQENHIYTIVLRTEDEHTESYYDSMVQIYPNPS